MLFKVSCHFLQHQKNISLFPFLMKGHIIFLAELTSEVITGDLRTLQYFSSFSAIYFLLSHFLTLILFLCFPVSALLRKWTWSAYAYNLNRGSSLTEPGVKLQQKWQQKNTLSLRELRCLVKKRNSFYWDVLKQCQE